jgi:NAD(P)H-flavin reductase
MTLDLESPRDVVCLAGGTGLAPMKALVEAMALTASPRRVHVFFGARRRTGLYDLDALRRLAVDHPWLTVIPAVSKDTSYPGERGTVSEVAARYGRWRRHDVYAAGSPAMIRGTLTRFLELGVRFFRVELLNEAPEAARSLIRSYTDLLEGRGDGDRLWRDLRASNLLGVTRGPLGRGDA